MIDLENKVAVITGASGGIGYATALELAKQKMKICIVGRKNDKLQKLKSDITKFTPDVLICVADLSSNADIEKVTSNVLKRFGTADILIHCAGYLSMGKIERATAESLELHFKVNLIAPYLITQALLPAIKESQGQIIFLNSSAVQRAIPNLAQYSSSKHALKGFADILREEVNPWGVRVTNIFPGQTATSMQQYIYCKNNKDYKPKLLLQPKDIADVVVNTLVMSRSAEITDIYIRPMQKTK